ncbi:MAG TPA: DoxX family protein [Kofleriaceae bacterium]|jgi:putative oxidoreductase|nr:DoxX family protein [Kofleriaceae bacterium]
MVTSARSRDWALVALRLVVGFGFAYHGYAKLARGPEHFATILSAMGIPAPTATAWLTTLVELGGGIALMLGVLVAPLCIPLGLVMATAMFGVHAQYGFSSVRLVSIQPGGAQFGPIGYELNLIYMTALVVLALAGPTPLSLDRRIAGRSRV